VTEDGIVVEVHKSEKKPMLWYWVWKLIENDGSNLKRRKRGPINIDVKSTSHAIYASGTNPHLAILGLYY